MSLSRNLTSWLLICSFMILRIQRSAADGMNTSELTKEIKRIFKTYDKRILPSPNGDPINVTMQIYVSDMIPVKRYFSHFDINMYIRQIWKDERLTLPIEEQKWQAFGVEALNDIWIPEIYFPAAKKGKWYEITKPNTALHIHQNGKVLLSRGIAQTIYCPMDLRNFPFDQQTCQMDIRFYAYNNDHCRLSWNHERGGPIFTAKKLEISEFSLKSLSYSKSVANFKNAGDYDTLSLMLVLDRNLNFYLINYILPCGLIVILSWVGFWIDYRSTPARASLGITTVLTITTLTNSIRASLPQVVYIKSIDVYLLTCFVFVFASTIEFAIVGITDVKWQKSFWKKHGKKKAEKRALERKEEIQLRYISRDESKRQDLKGNPNEADIIVEERDINESSISLHNEDSYSSEQVENSSKKMNKSPMASEATGSGQREEKIEKTTICCISKAWRNFVDYLAENHKKTRNEGHIVDRISRVVFPVLFLVFNALFYTVVYILHDNSRYG